MKGQKLLLTLLTFITVTACAPLASRRDSLEDVALRPEQRALAEQFPSAFEEARNFPGTDKYYPPLRIRYEQEVETLVQFYNSKGRGHIAEALERGSEHMPLFRAIFDYYGVPKELVSVAVIESKFVRDARSGAGARGIWQFMPATARDVGLDVSFFSDERTDVVKSTIAAARYFQRLYDVHGDWYLALAAYNGGSGRIGQAVQEAGSRDIFTIIRRESLYNETREYVPKVLAVAVIMKNLDLYGFSSETEV